MDDMHELFQTPYLQLTLKIEDMGERLHDYEPYWQWIADILIKNTGTFLEYSSPQRGYYLSEREEALEDVCHFLKQQSPSPLYQEEWEELLEDLWDTHVS